MRKQDAKDKRRYETFRFPFKFGYREIKSPDSHPGPAVLLRLILLHSSRCLIAHFAIVEAIIRKHLLNCILAHIEKSRAIPDFLRTAHTRENS